MVDYLCEIVILKVEAIMKKLAFIIIVLGFLIGCNGESRDDYCRNRGTICDGYGYNYYRCESYDPHFNRFHVWYEVWDEDEWKVWYSYGEMYHFYCE